MAIEKFGEMMINHLDFFRMPMDTLSSGTRFMRILIQQEIILMDAPQQSGDAWQNCSLGRPQLDLGDVFVGKI